MLGLGCCQTRLPASQEVRILPAVPTPGEPQRTRQAHSEQGKHESRECCHGFDTDRLRERRFPCLLAAAASSGNSTRLIRPDRHVARSPTPAFRDTFGDHRSQPDRAFHHAIPEFGPQRSNCQWQAKLPFPDRCGNSCVAGFGFPSCAPIFGSMTRRWIPIPCNRPAVDRLVLFVLLVSRQHEC